MSNPRGFSYFLKCPTSAPALPHQKSNPKDPMPHFEKVTQIKGKQNYLCKDCGRQFISDHERAYKGTLSWVKNMIKIMLVRGIGIRDIGVILEVSIGTVLKVLKSTKYKIRPKKPTTIALK
jgi:transposase-like protein